MSIGEAIVKVAGLLFACIIILFSLIIILLCTPLGWAGLIILAAVLGMI